VTVFRLLFSNVISSSELVARFVSRPFFLVQLTLSPVFGDAGFDMQPPLNVSVQVSGKMNDPAVKARGWFAVVALPLSGLIYNTTATLPPQSFWRINFSRVEW
jgi:hypothetical protein